jgi:predicted phosphoadenosine phosphosulfate sulfurtransferase
MSRGDWQTRKQMMLLKPGNTVTEKVNKYLKTWESRCYSDGIPDEVPALLARTLRAPSYKAIAMAILRNNINEIGIEVRSALADKLYRAGKPQGDLWG